MLRNRLLAASVAFALAMGQMSSGYAALSSPQFQTPAANNNSALGATTSFVSTALAKLKTDLLIFLQQSYTLQVPSAAALRTLGVFIGIMVHRGGFATPGDGGDADYFGVASACPNGDDGGACLNAPGGSWQTNISKGASITLWGAVANDTTDVQPAVVKAAAALSSVGGGRIAVPASTTCFILKAGVVIPANVTIRGEPGSCLDRGFASGNLIQLGTNATPAPNSGAYDLYIKHSVTASTFNVNVRNIAGNIVSVAVGSGDVVAQNAPFNHIDRINCQAGAYFCVTAENSGPNFITDLIASADGQSAIAMGCQQAGEPASVHIKGFDVAYQHRAALEMCNVGGPTITGGNTDFNLHSIWAHPGQIGGQNVPGQQASAAYITNSFFDFSTDIGFLIDGNQCTDAVVGFTGQMRRASLCHGSDCLCAAGRG